MRTGATTFNALWRIPNYSGFSLEQVGFEHGIWSYPYKLLPEGAIVAYIDVSPLSVIYMLEYQYFPRWKKFIKAVIVTALVFAFIFEPILELIGLYLPLSWYHYYGVPIYILLPILMRLAVEKVFASVNKTY
ncbi:hypothetical protein SRRS_54200 [Sporomusa rhizae]|uniref:CBO0543 family protein n=1 Tax=Sporomusa rhizae TaxID=357999 RepID=UPI00352ADE96